jgi:hypothetical protein
MSAQRFRKKPVVIEAMRLPTTYDAAFPTSDALVAVADWVRKGGGDSRFGGLGSLLIATMEGEMRGDPGDWIIRGVQGEHYPCKPVIFDKTYEPVE